MGYSVWRDRRAWMAVLGSLIFLSSTVYLLLVQQAFAKARRRDGHDCFDLELQMYDTTRANRSRQDGCVTAFLTPPVRQTTIATVKPRIYAKPWTNLAYSEGKVLLSQEVKKEGTQKINLNTTDILQLPNITYSPAYKNPCFFSSEGELICLPYFLVIGAAKCGTTDLYYLFKKHHQIAMPSEKEPFWFTGTGPLERYLLHFLQPAQRILKTVTSTRSMPRFLHPLITGEASPEYYRTVPHELRYTGNRSGTCSLWSTPSPCRIVAQDIRRLLPQVKLIFTMRNPTDRLYSDYNHFHHKSALHFHSLVEQAVGLWRECCKKYPMRHCAYYANLRERHEATLTYGLYDIFTEDLLKVFPREQIYFRHLEEYQKNEKIGQQEIFEFLDLEPPRAGIQWSRLAGGAYHMGPMLNTTRQLLDLFYRPHRQRLAKLLGDAKWEWKEHTDNVPFTSASSGSR